MPCFLRRWVAREGHEGMLRNALRRAHDLYVEKNPGLLESMMYREHFLGRELIGLALYELDAVVDGDVRAELLETLDKIAVAHAEVAEDSSRVTLDYEFTTIGRAGSHGAFALFRFDPARSAEFTERLRDAGQGLVERLAPSRVLVGHTPHVPGLAFALVDSRERVDLDRICSRRCTASTWSRWRRCWSRRRAGS